MNETWRTALKRFALVSAAFAGAVLLHWALLDGRLAPVAASPAWVSGTALLAWLLGTVLASQVLRHLLGLWVERRSGRKAPELLLSLGQGVLWLSSLTTASVVIYDAPVGGALTTSGVVVAIVGFALRNLIADLFYGITMALERPFELGDWIGTADDTTGRVEEFTWRAVKLVTHGNLKIIIPNSQLANAQIINYDQPDPVFRSDLEVTLAHDLPSERAERILLAAAEQVPESAALGRPPEVRILRQEERGVVWALLFWVPSYAQRATIGYAVYQEVLHNLRMAGLSPPRTREEVLVEPLVRERETESDRAANWLERIEVLAVLSAAQRRQLQSRALPRLVPVGEEVVREGERGESLFAVQEGVFDVWQGSNHDRGAVARLRAGDVFGEMSLLTGSQRSATVVAATDGLVHEITKQDLEPFLREDEGLAGRLAQIVAGHRQTDAQRRDVERAPDERAEAGRVEQIAKRIRVFFRL